MSSDSMIEPEEDTRAMVEEPAPGLCDTCGDEAAHKSEWGAFCEVSWMLFGFAVLEPGA